MKRWVIIALGLAVALLLPEGQGTDVAKLQPVELLYIYKEADRITIETDTDSMGVGYTLEDAVNDMRVTARGKLFLDTAEYVLVTEDTKYLIPSLRELIRPAAKLILATGAIDPEELTGFLGTQKPEVTFLDCLTSNPKLPKLMTAGERYYIVQ